MKKNILLSSIILIAIGAFIFLIGFLLGGLDNFQVWFS